MGEITVEQCPETEICSIVKPGGKVDLMPDEAEKLAAAKKDPAAMRAILNEVDSGFAGNLSDDEVAKIASTIKG